MQLPLVTREWSSILALPSLVARRLARPIGLLGPLVREWVGPFYKFMDVTIRLKRFARRRGYLVLARLRSLRHLHRNT